MAEQTTLPALVAHAEGLGLQAEDLDETIYEMQNTVAAQRVNASASNESIDSPTIYGQEHDDAEARASRINNEGLSAQIGEMLSAWGCSETEIALDEIAAELMGA